MSELPEAFNCILVLGPTACGKTKLAVALAAHTGGAVFSLDSRQVYRGLNIGTGKDLHEFRVNETTIPHFLIDVADAGENYNLSRFIYHFNQSWNYARQQGLFPVLCGGTGLYANALLQNHAYVNVPRQQHRREVLESLSLEELSALFEPFALRFPGLDRQNPRRLVRAIEIGEYLAEHPLPEGSTDFALKPLAVGVHVPVRERRKRIADRLNLRLRNGLVEEVEGLLAAGVSAGWLAGLGLEYKFVTMHLTGQLAAAELEKQLCTAIHQFAKRQMTWFRKLEREGLHIHWIPPETPAEDILALLTPAPQP